MTPSTAASERLYREALSMRRRLYGNEQPAIVPSLNGVGFVLRRSGRDYAEAERFYREALALAQKLYQGPHADLADSHVGIGASLNGQSKNAEAEPHLRTALAMHRALEGERDHLEVAAALTILGSALAGQEKWSEAVATQREAVAMTGRLLGEDHVLYLTRSNNLARALEAKGELQEAERLFRELLAQRRRLYPLHHAGMALAIANIGGVRCWPRVMPVKPSLTCARLPPCTRSILLVGWSVIPGVSWAPPSARSDDTRKPIQC